MVGRTEIQVLVPIYSEMSLLLLTNGSIPDPVLLSVGGMKFYYVASSYNFKLFAYVVNVS